MAETLPLLHRPEVANKTSSRKYLYGAGVLGLLGVAAVVGVVAATANSSHSSDSSSSSTTSSSSAQARGTGAEGQACLALSYEDDSTSTTRTMNSMARTAQDTARRTGVSAELCASYDGYELCVAYEAGDAESEMRTINEEEVFRQMEETMRAGSSNVEARSDDGELTFSIEVKSGDASVKLSIPIDTSSTSEERQAKASETMRAAETRDGGIGLSLNLCASADLATETETTARYAGVAGATVDVTNAARMQSAYGRRALLDTEGGLTLQVCATYSTSEDGDTGASAEACATAEYMIAMSSTYSEARIAADGLTMAKTADIAARTGEGREDGLSTSVSLGLCYNIEEGGVCLEYEVGL